jgi:monooxygenase
VRNTAQEYGVDQHIRYGTRVTHAAWSSAEQRWTLTLTTAAGEKQLTCSFLLWCSGYYRYDHGYTPELPGIENYGGTIVHPQHWDPELDYAGKRVVIIGSGATAVTLVPAMTQGEGRAAHITQLQRTPSYVLSIGRTDPVAEFLNRWLPSRIADPIVRTKNITQLIALYQISQRFPGFMKGVLRKGAAAQLPEGYAVDTHFNPPYNPWDQRMCMVPDGDLFTALRAGTASIVTDRIETFTETGIRLQSGQELEADVVITATGLNLQLFGGADLEVDGSAVNLPDTMAYRGMMLSGVPNLVFMIGYTNASWTLKVDLVAEYFCRLLRWMDTHGRAVAVPERDPAVEERPLLDFDAGYVKRSIRELPSGGDRAPWTLAMNYAIDAVTLRRARVDDGMRFEPAHAPVRA